VPEIRMMGMRNELKEHDNRLAQTITGFDGRVERGIIRRSLRALHPVNHASTVGVGRPRPPNG